MGQRLIINHLQRIGLGRLEKRAYEGPQWLVACHVRNSI
jgi:hypothetical protein